MFESSQPTRKAKKKVMDSYEVEKTPEFQEIMSHLPELMTKKYQLNRAGFQIVAVMLPARLNIPFTGDDADPNFQGSMMGLPISWSEQEKWGLVV